MDLPFRKMIDIPPVWLALALALTWVQGRVLPFGPVPGFGARWVGAGLILCGLALILLAAYALRRARTTIIPHLKPSAIVTDGVFALSRNPIYLADALILAGCSLRWHAYGGMALVPVFMALISVRFIASEEARLRREFEGSFDAYALKVRRWL